MCLAQIMPLLGPKNEHDIGVQAYLDISCHLDVPNCTKIALTTLYLHILRASTTLSYPLQEYPFQTAENQKFKSWNGRNTQNLVIS